MATGFIVRNAADAGSALDLAEPDALDFNLLSRQRFGVLTMGATGRDPVVLSGWNVSVPAGVVVVNDALVTCGGSVTLPTSSQQPRFDLIAVDAGGTTVYVRGTASPNPVYPDYDDTVTILAAVYITPGQSPPDATRDITDKRRFLSQRFLSTVTAGDLLANYSSTPTLSPVYTVSSVGRTEWMTDTRIFRSAAKTLRVEDNLDVAKALTADSAVVGKTLTVNGDISAANLLHGQGPPGATPGTAGDLYQDQQNGGLWSYEGGAWVRLSTTPIPAGTVITSLNTTQPAGWLSLNGQKVDQATAGNLWTVFPQWRTSDGTGLTLPNLNGMFLRMGMQPGNIGGLATATLQVANMPPHTHIDQGPGGAVTTGYAGEHTHLASTEGAGDHGHYTVGANDGYHHHDVDDHEHFHEGVAGGNGGGFVYEAWGGRRRLDGPFNDASHPVAVDVAPNTVPSPSHVFVKDGGTHQHFTNTVPPHTHPVTVTPYNSSHFHGIPERSVGGGQEFSILPPYMVVNYLIKT